MHNLKTTALTKIDQPIEQSLRTRDTSFHLYLGVLQSMLKRRKYGIRTIGFEKKWTSMKSIYIALCFALASFGTPVVALDDLSNAGSCTIFSEWELGHIILVTKQINGTDDDIMSDNIVLMLSHEEWSIRAGDSLNFVLRFEGDDGSWLSNTPKSIDYGMMISTKIDYLENFNQSDNVQIFKEKQRIVVLDWNSFAPDVQMFRLCLAKARAPVLERRRQESVRAATPRDPFEKPSE